MTDKLPKKILEMREIACEKTYPKNMYGDFAPIAFVEGFDAGYLAHAELTRGLVEALEFYADIENWDDDKFNPTVWDDGNIDMGKKAMIALAEIYKLRNDDFYPEPGGPVQPNLNDNPIPEGDDREAW